MKDDCVFCKIAAGEIPADVVFQDDEIMAFRDLSPAAPTHILIIPKKHLVDLESARPDDSTLLGKILLKAGDLAESEGLVNGWRIVQNNGKDGGQSVFHLHFHLLGGRRMGWPPG